MSFDRATYRDKFLNGFKPKEMDISTPYLALPDGETLDGKLKLRGITGKEGLDMRKASTVNGVMDDTKLIGKLACKCLYLRAVDGLTNEQISDGNTPFLEPTDEMAFLDMGLDTFNELGGAILEFTGMKQGTQEEAKKKFANKRDYERACFILAARLTRTVEELLDNIDSGELVRWFAFLEQEQEEIKEAQKSK